MKQILSKIALADKDYGLIQENDIIAVGVSGGKDSTLLLYALELYRIKYRRNFKVIGIHIDLGFGEEDFSPIQSFFDQYEIPLYAVDSKVSRILHQQLTKDGRIRCSLCSKFKKALVIAEGKKYNCNKVAFAHHADDAVETLLLNMIYGGRLACFTPFMPLTETGISFIRPFVYTREKDIIAAHSVNHLPKIKSGCPMDGATKRQEIKDLLNQIYTDYPQSKENFLMALHNLDNLDLWIKKKDVDK